MPNDDYLPVRDVARRLRRDVRTIHRMIERGELPATKAFAGLRAPYLVARKDVDRILAERVAS